MNPTIRPEDIDNMVMYERSSERRSGIERRGNLMNNKDLGEVADKQIKTQLSADTKYIGEFG